MTAPQYGQQPYYQPPEGIAITAKYSTAVPPPDRNHLAVRAPWFSVSLALFLVLAILIGG
jgi:hypothetical protein